MPSDSETDSLLSEIYMSEARSYTTCQVEFNNAKFVQAYTHLIDNELERKGQIRSTATAAKTSPRQVLVESKESRPKNGTSSISDLARLE